MKPKKEVIGDELTNKIRKPVVEGMMTFPSSMHLTSSVVSGPMERRRGPGVHRQRHRNGNRQYRADCQRQSRNVDGLQLDGRRLRPVPLANGRKHLALQ